MRGREGERGGRGMKEGLCIGLALLLALEMDACICIVLEDGYCSLV